MIGIRTLALWGAMGALALTAGAAAAQPTAKSYALDAETRDILWCSVVFYEETFWHDPESPEEVYYDGLSLDLDAQAFATMDSGPLNQDQAYELWELYADEAYRLYEEDNAAFVFNLEECEDRFGTGGPAASDASGADKS